MNLKIKLIKDSASVDREYEEKLRNMIQNINMIE